MKKILIKLAIVLLVVGGTVLVSWPTIQWRLYDAEWQPLAMTKAESFCAGMILAERGFINLPNDIEVDKCVANSKHDNTTPNLGMAVRWGCTGVQAVDSSYPIEACLEAIEYYQLWFLQHGGYTWNWNDGHKRPVIAFTNIREAPRGERNNNIRDDEERFQQ